MSRETWIPALAVVAIAIIAWGIWWSSNDARETQRAHDRREREDREAHETDEMQTESAALLDDALPGVTLFSDLEAVRSARGGIQRASSHVDPGFELYEEALPNGAQAVYAFSEHSGLLERVQVLSQLPSIDGLAPHLSAMTDRYGTPTGAWDCRDAGGLGTRRFTWRGSHLAVADIVLLYGERVSLTLYVTTNEQMTSSLRRANCTPITVDQLDHFPTAAAADIQRAVREQEEEEGQR